MDTSTIAAVATPPGAGGIGVIKISGPLSLQIAQTLFRRRKSPVVNPSEQLSDQVPAFESHKLTHGYILDPDSGRLIDEVLLVYMQGPGTYTCEDVLEIQAHSGYVALTNILEAVLRLDARLAEPGEFTKRAFLNGRIDLSQAEAVMDLIHAKTLRALQAATGQLRGGLTRKIQAVIDSLREALVWIEAGIDFPEDVGPEHDPAPVVEALRLHGIRPLEKLLEKYRESVLLRDGIQTTIAGRPNVGKSSLMNRLIEKERAIVTPFPGTTRDIIEELFSVDGIPVVINDTAGLQDTEDPVEVIGIQRAEDCLQNSELVLFVVDGSMGIIEKDHRIYQKIGDLERIIVVNKCDLLEPDNYPALPEEWSHHPVVYISALYNTGIDRLKTAIVSFGDIGSATNRSDRIMPNLRQKEKIEAGLASLKTAIMGFEDQNAYELIGIDLREALAALSAALGKAADLDLLEDVFSRFCIGK